jgi:hypothetical protein
MLLSKTRGTYPSLLATAVTLCAFSLLAATLFAPAEGWAQGSGDLPGVKADDQVASTYWGGAPTWNACIPMATGYNEPPCPTPPDCGQTCGSCACMGKGCLGSQTTTRCDSAWQGNALCCVNHDFCVLNGNGNGCDCIAGFDIGGKFNWGIWQC